MNNKIIRFIRLICLLIAIYALFANNCIYASYNLGLDADARLRIVNGDDFSSEIHVVGISLRKIFSDNKGDRFIFFGLLEGHDNLSDWMLHELYLQFKGPMGRWNLTAGRYGLPFGLSTDYTASRSLFDSLYPITLGFDVDSGLMLHGVVDDIDYGISFSQGHGAHGMPGFPGEALGTGRMGYTFGEFGDIRMGLSFAAGRTRSINEHDFSHHEQHSSKLRLIAIDATIQPARSIAKMELQFGKLNDNSIIGGFGMLEYALTPRLDLNLAGRFLHEREHTEGYGYLGTSFRAPWFTLRGGYTYDTGNKDHIVSFQIYWIYSYPF